MIKPFASATVCLLLFTVLSLPSCGDGFVPVPKPRSFPRVIYPEKAYVPFTEAYCDFSFEVPKYAKIEQDTLFFDEKAKSDCWFNIKVPELNAQIYCSYYPITSQSRFDELVQDAFVMATKHNIKANYIEEIPIHRPKDKVHGIIFDIDGPAASTYQFFLTDSTSNFLRGALYFNSQTRQDSLGPVIKFMKADVDHLVQTLQWKK